jgi:hypothetical protein
MGSNFENNQERKNNTNDILIFKNDQELINNKTNKDIDSNFNNNINTFLRINNSSLTLNPFRVSNQFLINNIALNSPGVTKSHTPHIHPKVGLDKN